MLLSFYCSSLPFYRQTHTTQLKRIPQLFSCYRRQLKWFCCHAKQRYIPLCSAQLEALGVAILLAVVRSRHCLKSVKRYCNRLPSWTPTFSSRLKRVGCHRDEGPGRKDVETGGRERRFGGFSPSRFLSSVPAHLRAREKVELEIDVPPYHFEVERTKFKSVT